MCMAAAVTPRGVDVLTRARVGTWTAFCVTGAVAATYAGRVPAVQDRLSLSPGGLAVAALAIEGGALLGLPLGAALVGRWGSRRSTQVGYAVFAPGLLVGALAPTPVWLAVGLALWAAANSVVDVALNAQGVALGARYGRSVLSGLHAGQGVGLLAGAAAATVAAALDVPLLTHVGVVAALAAGAGMAAAAPQLPLPAGPAPVLVRPSRRLLLLGGVAFCAFLVDGAATTWIAVQLRVEHGAGAGVAAAGYLGFTIALVLGRLSGDRLVSRFGRRRTTVACGLGTAAAAVLAVLAPVLPLALAGWALIGLAVAPLAPITLGAAPDRATGPAPVAIAGVTTVGYLGSFTGPAVIGGLAELSGLSTALLLLAAAGAAAALLARAALAPP